MRLTATRRARTRTSLLTLCLVAACGKEPAPAPPQAATHAPPAAPAAPARPNYYDAEGRLRASDHTLAGVPIPVGFVTQPSTDPHRHVLRSKEIPLDKVVQYYGPRLFTGQIERQGAGVIYRHAVPMDDRGSALTLDVRITPVGVREVVVTLQEHAPAPVVTPSVDALEKTLLREQKQIE